MMKWDDEKKMQLILQQKAKGKKTKDKEKTKKADPQIYLENLNDSTLYSFICFCLLSF